MLKVLIPVDGSSNSQHAVRHVLREFRSNPAMDIHLLNGPPPFSRYITRWVDRKAVNEVHAEVWWSRLPATRHRRWSVTAFR